MRKIGFSLFIPLLFMVLLGTPNHSFAADDEIFIDNGKIKDGRMLIPLRAVSEALGANVTWSQQEKTVTIVKGTNEALLTINSMEVISKTQNSSSRDLLDVPAQVDKGVTYVPLRYVTYSVLKAQIGWDQAKKQASLVSDGKKVVVQGHYGKVVQAPQISDQRLRTLLTKLEDATDLSRFSQIREHFRPYFTDQYINELIRDGGLRFDYRFKIDPLPEPTSNGDNRMLLSQSNEFDVAGKKDTFLHRSIAIVNTPNGWKIDSVAETEWDFRP